MIKRLWSFPLLVCCSTLLAATIYKTKDESGAPVFSDQAGESAEQVKVKDTTTFKSSEYTRQYKQASDLLEKNEAKTAENFKYETLAITSPLTGTAIRNNAGTIELHFSVRPGVQPGHTIQLMMDGQVYSPVGTTGSVSIANVDRGTHQFQLTATRTADGKVLQAGPPTSITLQRFSRQH